MSSLRVPRSEPPVVLVAGVRTDSDRLKLVCEYEMPAVTHPIVPLTLLQPELVSMCNAHVAAVLLRIIAATSLTLMLQFTGKYERPN